jgi:diguanylate cyclase (GGDEF)-like protein
MNPRDSDPDLAPRQSTAHLEHIIAVQAELASAHFDLNTFMQMVVSRALELTQATGAVVELVEGEEMAYRAVSGSAAPYYGTRLKMGTSLSGLCVRTGEITISNNTATDPRVDAEMCKKVGAASMVVVPLFQSGQTVGVLKIISVKPDAFDRQDVQTLQLMAGLLGGALGQQLAYNAKQQLLEDRAQMMFLMQSEIIRREEVEQKLTYIAQHDALTDLPNRTMFYDRLSHAIARATRDKTGLGLFYIDVDHFKEVNDTYGHAAGDEYLRCFATAVQNAVRKSDTLARLGGDEFALIAENLKDAEEAALIAKKAMQAIHENCRQEGRILPSTASIGIAMLQPGDTNPDVLIKQADAAMYEAKRTGRDRYVIQ